MNKAIVFLIAAQISIGILFVLLSTPRKNTVIGLQTLLIAGNNLFLYLYFLGWKKHEVIFNYVWVGICFFFAIYSLGLSYFVTSKKIKLMEKRGESFD